MGKTIQIEQQNRKKNFAWNTVAGFVNASESVIILMVCNRTWGTELTGTLTIAFAIANLVMAVGKYGMRTFQVTDLKNQYSDIDYIVSRIVTVGLMILGAIIYEVYYYLQHIHSFSKVIIILLLCLIYANESFEDVFTGLLQKNGRLDLGSKIFAFRWFIILILFTFGLYLKCNIVLVELIALFISIVIDVKLIQTTKSIWIKKEYTLNFDKVKSLLKNCFSLFLISFLSLYITNSPKYAIDRQLPNVEQAYYGFISTPVFTIALVNSFFYQPFLLEITDLWRTKDKKGFLKLLRKCEFILFGLTIFVLIASFFLGIPILDFIYHTQLENYKMEFLLIMVGAGFLALAGYLCVVLTIIRQQSKVVLGYIFVAVISLIFSSKIAESNGILGLAVFYDIQIFLLCAFFTIATRVNIINMDEK